jgi:uncharacterized protein (TIGR02284 family)
LNDINDILKNLITINKNRIVNHKSAVHQLDDEDVGRREFLEQIIRQSENNIAELNEELTKAGTHTDDKTITAGIIYNTWTDILYGETDPNIDIKKFCEQAEQSALDVYEKILLEINDPSAKIHSLLSKQAAELKAAHHYIKMNF